MMAFPMQPFPRTPCYLASVDYCKLTKGMMGFQNKRVQRA